MRCSIENSASVLNKYSVLHNYYDKNLKKPLLYSSCNLLSKPWRRVLGGIDVYIPSQTYETKMSTTKRVATVFFFLSNSLHFRGHGKRIKCEYYPNSHGI